MRKQRIGLRWAVRGPVLVAGLLAVVAAAFHAGLPRPESAGAAGPYADPHNSGSSPTADTCATCHRGHVGKNRNALVMASPQSSLCLACHNGTGANSNVAAEFSDPTIPANNAATASYYSHPATTPSNHTNAQTSEFAGVLNRHAECSDCHNSHQIKAGVAPSATAAGWTASGALTGATGVTKGMPPVWKNPVSYEYELCLKCHSSYTTLLSNTKESYKMTDVAAEFQTTNASFHPVEGPGKNATANLQNSLNGGKLWHFNVGDTIRCTNCHANGALVGATPVLNSPATTARLAPHASKNPNLLIANYRDRVLKSSGEAYSSNDFALCFLCHAEAAFTSSSSTNTNFSRHSLHVSNISGGNTGTDIDTAGAGSGRALCAECHYRIHSTSAAYQVQNQTNSRLVNFAPNVVPRGTTPMWVVTVNGTAATGSCNLTCHGQSHSPETYSLPASGVPAAAVQGPAPLSPAGGIGIAGVLGTGAAPGSSTSTRQSTPTPTSASPARTPTPTRAPAGATSSIPTATPVPTNTPLPTATPVPTATPTPTSTPVPPTSTPRPTATPVRTNTPKPTSTRVPTRTPTPRATRTP